MLTPATLAAALAADKKRIAELPRQEGIGRSMLDAYRYWARDTHHDIEIMHAELPHIFLADPLAALARSIKYRKKKVRTAKKERPENLMFYLFANAALDDIHRHLARAIRNQLDTINQETKK
jgi:hypothetical protein